MIDYNFAVDICGVILKNPIIAASGTMGFGHEYAAYFDINKLGGITVKGLTLEPRQGNPAPRIAETPSGILNSVGLQNPGIQSFIINEMKFLRQLDTVILVNIAGNTIEDYCSMAEQICKVDIDLIELNISCPNVKGGGVAFGTHPNMIFNITKQVKKYCTKPLIVKLSPNTANISENALAAQEGGADGVSLINTILGMEIDVHSRKPLLGNITGGLSGPAIRPIALRMVWEVAKSVAIPVIGMGGIMTGEDVVAFMLAGATAVSIGTANLVEPDACLRILNELKYYMEKYYIYDIREIIGALDITDH